MGENELTAEEKRRLEKIIKDNLAIARSVGDYESIFFADKAIDAARRLGDLERVISIAEELGYPHQITAARFAEEKLGIDSAIPFYEKAGVSGFLNLAKIYEQKGDFAKASRYYEGLGGVHMGDAFVAAQKAGDTERVNVLLNRILEIISFHESRISLPGGTEDMKNMAVLYRKIGQPEKAFEWYLQRRDVREVAELAPEAGNFQAGIALCEKYGWYESGAVLARKTGDLQTATRLHELELSTLPRDMSSGFAMSETRRERLDFALQLANKLGDIEKFKELEQQRTLYK